MAKRRIKKIVKNFEWVSTKFDSQAKCVKLLNALRGWKHGAVCPYCRHDKVSNRKNELRYICRKCKRSFSVTTKTLIEGIKIPLFKFFKLVYYLTNNTGGFSAIQAAHELELSYPTVLRASMIIRCGMGHNCEPLEGLCEADETFTTSLKTRGNRRNRRGRGTDKLTVMGIVEREGKLRYEILEKQNAETLLKFITKHVKAENTYIFTDEFRGYRRLKKKYNHLRIEHKKEFKHAIIHTNTIENCFSMLKKSLRGTYKAFRPDYLRFFLNEAEFRYNHRDFDDKGFIELLTNIVTSQNDTPAATRRRLMLTMLQILKKGEKFNS